MSEVLPNAMIGKKHTEAYSFSNMPCSELVSVLEFEMFCDKGLNCWI